MITPPANSVIARKPEPNFWGYADITLYGKKYVRVRCACRVFGLDPVRELARLRATVAFGLEPWQKPGRRRPVAVLPETSARVWLGLGIDDRDVSPRVQRLLEEAQRDLIRAVASASG